jgi:hypothetical protein
VDSALALALVVFAVGLAVWAARDEAFDRVALGGALVLASMLFSRLLSPQYLTWLAPFVAVLWIRGHRAVGWLSIVAAWLTVVEMLWFEDHLIEGSKVMGAVVLARNVTLVVLLVVLVSAIRQPAEDRPRVTV